MPRKVENLVDFESKVHYPEEQKSPVTKLKSVVAEWGASCDVKGYILSLVPIVNTLRSYKLKTYIPNDVAAGLTTGIIMVPQGMAFAALSTLPPIVGLYVAFFASISYVLFGTGRQVSWGCIAILSLMMADVLDKYAHESEQPDSNATSADTLGNLTSEDRNSLTLSDERKMEFASSISVVAGLIFIAASRIGLSRITRLMSNSLITGYTIGLSTHVLTSQFTSVLGISVYRYKGLFKLIRTWIELCAKIPDTNVASLIITLCCIALTFPVKKFINEKFRHRLPVPVPIELVILILGTLASYYGGFNENFGVDVIEDVPTGIPEPKLPDFVLVQSYIADGLVIAVVAYAQTLSVAKTMGLKNGYSVDADQEMMASGLSFIICGFFSGYIAAGSVSASFVQDSMGGKTVLASLFASCVVLLVIMVLGPYFYSLPMCVLAAIIIVNLIPVFSKLLTIPTLWRKSKKDCSVWVFSVFATIFLNADIGLIASVIFSLLTVFYTSTREPVTVVGQVSTESSGVQLRSLTYYPSAVAADEVKVIRINTPLYFINSDAFITSAFTAVGVDPLEVKAAMQNENVRQITPDVRRRSTRKDSQSSNQALLFEVSWKADEDGSLGLSKTYSAAWESDDVVSAVRPPGVTVTSVVLDVSEVSFIDVMGVQALEHVIDQLCSVGIRVGVIRVPETIFAMFKSTGFWERCGHRLYLDLKAAFRAMGLDSSVIESGSQFSRLIPANTPLSK
ncbi:pendrin-like [Aplysia californica]|uniref:Pendrin-like n=1 Tax=Aplysia californica TaxID=6500 RepID=A0ABM0JXR7_APLCA|nr:pendrin-like [Aplysia californica]